MTDEELYNAIRKEATESNYYDGKSVGKDTLLYKFVAEQAREVSVDINEIHIHVLKNNSSSASMLLDNLIIGDGNFKKGNLKTLRGAIKHELQHKKQGMLSTAIDNIFSGFNMHGMGRKSECEADFAAGKDIVDWLDLHLGPPSAYFEADEIHPSHRDRMKSGLIKSYIEDKTGVILKPEDVKIAADCSFEITNAEKAKAIPAKIIEDARKNAEVVAAEIDKAFKLQLENPSSPTPKIPGIAKTNDRPASR